MKCPYCGMDQDRVVDTRAWKEGRAIRRRRYCEHCDRRFITIEEIEDKTLSVIKSDNRREPFNRQKLRRGIEIACRKRPISMDQIEKLVERVEFEIENAFIREVPSRQIGELVSRYLRELDEVAYVRFASVYRNFRDREEFLRELNQMNTSTSEPENRKDIEADAH